jgi:acetylornithine/N-succinyldiaminopimelate aminotransferase
MNIKNTDFFMNTYKRPDILIKSGIGCEIKDADDKIYKDFVAGIAVCGLGHCHPKIVKAVTHQINKIFHISNLYYTKPQIELGKLLIENSFADKVFFSNSGTEAIEAAVKLARKYFKDKGDENRFKIITMERSFHGRTFAAMSATGNDKIKKGFSPLLEGFIHVPFNDIKAVKSKLDESVCAIMIEPIQGEGGIIPADIGYIKDLRKLCDDKGIILIFDEIQTGIGRTGKLFAYEHFGVVPDIMTLAKALGNGLPIGALLAKEDIAKAFNFGSHGSTFGGNPVCCAAGVAVINIIKEEKLLDNCRKQGKYFKAKLLKLKEKHKCIKKVRGIGLIIGMELDIEAAPIALKCIDKGFLINPVQDKVLRFVPPIIINEKDIDELINCLDEVFSL